MRRCLFFLMMLFCVANLRAQGDVEYRMEIGGGAGLINYTGDYNSSLVKNLQPMASAIFRRVFNPYCGLKMNLSYGKLKGSSEDEKTYYPEAHPEPYTFNNSLVDLGTVFEYNLLPYGTGRDYRGAKRVVPFVFAGIGVTYVKADKNVFTANVPFGVGVKYKVRDRMNVGVEWAMHLSMSDELDGSKDPYHIKSTGLFKNTDCYGMLQVTLTYSFSAKCRTCHNDDE